MEFQLMGIKRDSKEMYYQLPISSYTELVQFRYGLRQVIEQISRNYEMIEEGEHIEFKEEVEAINLLSRLNIALCAYELNTASILNDVIENKPLRVY